MQSTTSVTATTDTEKKQRRNAKRLNPTDTSAKGFVRLCDWSVKDRNTHNKEMQAYRQYLRKLCNLTDEVLGRRHRNLE